MNPLIEQLQPYPFERLARLKDGIVPPEGMAPLSLSIGEPRHAPPEFIGATLTENRARLSDYPATRGLPELRAAMADWLIRRFGLPPDAIDPERHVLPCNGSREALFSIAQAVIDPTANAWVVMPNPFYQIYEGAALLAGARPYFLNTTAEQNYLPDFASVPSDIWANCPLVYVCSPGNPTGAVLDAAAYRRLLDLADRYGFIVASDECYSELYADEANPPTGLLQAAHAAGNTSYSRCLVFNSLSKRSNVPGLRSGLIAGDAALIQRYLLYRTYHGCAMSVPTQLASARAWRDEAHVIENRALYRAKFSAIGEILDTTTPAGGFFIWLPTPGDDEAFAQGLFAAQNVTVLPGSYLSRSAHGQNPGHGHVRIALVPPLNACLDAAKRIQTFLDQL